LIEVLSLKRLVDYLGHFSRAQAKILFAPLSTVESARHRFWVRLKVGEKSEDNCGIKCTNLAISVNTVGMKEKKRARHNLSPQESHLLQQLRQRPQMMERVQKILEIADNAEGPLKTADQIEELLIEEMRQLGHETMHQWAVQAEERVSQELKSQDPTVLHRKKKR
jgi:hypothetical protein